MRKKIIPVTLFTLFTDIISKLSVDSIFNYMESKTIIKNFFSITKVYNTGASWSILSGKQTTLIIVTVILITILYWYQSKFMVNKRNIIAFGVLYGGILGNLVDRIFYGHVIDFLDFNIFGYNYPVFNFADIFIVSGVLLLIIAIIKKEDLNEVSSRTR